MVGGDSQDSTAVGVSQVGEASQVMGVGEVSVGEASQVMEVGEAHWEAPRPTAAQQGYEKEVVVEAAEEGFVAEFVAERIDRSRCIGCRWVPF